MLKGCGDCRYMVKSSPSDPCESCSEYSNWVDADGDQLIRELLEALKPLVAYGMISPVEGVAHPVGTHKECIDKARQAIEKAEGITA